MKWQGLINHYREYLPVSDRTPVVTLNEGNTPLIRAENTKKYLAGGIEVFYKYEGLNPTGSFKDRGMTMAISKAVEEKSCAVICASTGNTSASAAAYSTRAGLKCVVIIPKDAIAMGKLAQALIHKALVIAIDGNFDDAFRMVTEINEKYPITLVNSVNPYRLQGQKTAAFEICDFLGDAPEYHAIPVGNAGNITAYWMGYTEYKKHGKSKRLPKMLGFQAAGAAPIVEDKVVENPKTLATAIKIGNPASWKQAVAAKNESGGLIDKVTDDEIIEAYKILAGYEGIFCEPASAASLAGVIKLDKKGFFKGQKARVTCTLTGHGLKDPDIALKSVEKPIIVKADLKEVVKVIGFK
ncbi:MAG TPA: threonine synthase [bacterium]|nr:threonine synthase [bacterium]